MGKLDSIEINKVAESCIELYTELPKTGKPLVNEWTILSCVVKYEKILHKFEVVSLGTGSKCIGASELSPKGFTLNDSHAEVQARRGFLLYLYNEIINCLGNTESIFVCLENKRFKLQNNVEFIFYSSKLPCGDASIMPKLGVQDKVKTLKRTADTDICNTEQKIKKNCGDIHRTGAKCLPDAEQDPKGLGTNYHLIGEVRTKPGRGERTLSVSCSDKMAKWIHLGIQGSLLDLLLSEPIYLSSFVFGGGEQFSQESLKRALLQRNLEESDILRENVPDFYQCSIEFPHRRKEKKFQPAPGSIVWVKSKERILEVAVQGKKLGVTKKTSNTVNCALSISKAKLYKKFQEVLLKIPQLRLEISANESLESIPYNVMKKKSLRYLNKSHALKEKLFTTWTVKPDIWNFTTLEA